MRRLNDYSTLIFDCDGVIFDSNNLKIEAMGRALSEVGCSPSEVRSCQEFFAANFGKSRFYHVDYFLKQLLSVSESDREALSKRILASFSGQCQKLYLEADTTPDIVLLLQSSRAQKHIASGSEESELQGVFSRREMQQYFGKILGSPRKKSDLVADILENADPKNTVMIGDARSDLEAARVNGIDFIYYSPFSNVDALMRQLCVRYGYRIVDSFSEVLKEV